MKVLCFLFFLPVLALPSFGQSLMSNGGGYHTNSNGSLTFSIGEPVIQTFSAGNYILSQGFNQTRLIITGIDEIKASSDIRAWPNPTNQFLVLDHGRSEAGHALLLDASGKQVSDFPLSGQTNTIDMRSFANGAYILKVLDKKNKDLQSFRVILVK